MVIMKAMKIILLILLYFILPSTTIQIYAQDSIKISTQVRIESYLEDIKKEMVKKWPKNRTINLVFHGHSVPAGYSKEGVNTFASYPFLLLKELKSIYPDAVINVIITAIGGENSKRGEMRIKDQVLVHRPDVLFIDYALNDRGIGLQESRKYMELMIKAALEKNIKIILLTPSPDQRVDIMKPDNELQLFANQIIELSQEYNIGMVDSYGLFKSEVSAGKKLVDFMSQINHPNKEGHQLIANGILKYFIPLSE